MTTIIATCISLGIDCIVIVLVCILFTLNRQSKQTVKYTTDLTNMEWAYDTGYSDALADLVDYFIEDGTDLDTEVKLLDVTKAATELKVELENG